MTRGALLLLIILGGCAAPGRTCTGSSPLEGGTLVCEIPAQASQFRPRIFTGSGIL